MVFARVMNAIWRIARVLLLVCLGVVVLAMLFEDRFIYFPWKHPSGMWEVQEPQVLEGQILPSIEDGWVITQDGLKLHGWYCTPGQVQDGVWTAIPSETVFLFFHGNAGNITNRYDIIRALMPLPVDVFILDYRGYGRSPGRPSEDGLYIDARAAWDYLVNHREISQDRIIIFGKSLGGAVAIDLATHVTPAGLIVQSSFTSIPDMARTIFPFIPRFLVRTKMDSIQKITKIECPKLFVHSPSDEVVPYKFGRRLFEAAIEPKTFYTVQGASHNETYAVGGEAYLDALRRFIQSCTPPRSSH